MTLEDSASVTSSRGLQGGRSPCRWQAGQMMLPFGPDLVPASHSATQVGEGEPTTSDTCGPSSEGLLTSADLQRSLESRLRVRLEGSGSPLYVLTWKHWDMRSGEPICALRASGHRTSGKGCSGWPTASTRDGKGGYQGGRIRNGKLSVDVLDVAEQLGQIPSGWVTPDSSPRGGTIETGPRPSGHPRQVSLQDQAKQAGLTPSSSPAETEKPGQLNPAFVAWLMGYPGEWLSCVDWETRSSRKSRQSS